MLLLLLHLPSLLPMLLLQLLHLQLLMLVLLLVVVVVPLLDTVTQHHRSATGRLSARGCRPPASPA